MNKAFLVISLVATCLQAHTQTTLTNLGLEGWTTSNSGRYEEPDAPWQSANPGVDFDLTATVDPVEKVTDAYSGDYAAKMESANIFFTFTAGALWTGNFELNLTDPAQSAKFGVPYEGTPTNLKFYYKYFPVNGDSMGVYTILRKWNPDTQQQDTIAYAEVRQTQTVDEYTLFDLPLNYYIENTLPDSIEIAFTASAAGFEYMGEIGSTLYIDEVELENEVGIIQVWTPEVHIKTFPNPVTNQVHFELDKFVNNTTLLIFDSTGKQMTTLNIANNYGSLYVSHWNSGTYYFLLKNEKGHDLSSGQFVVK